MKVGIVAPYPPPRGGVSVHAQRLAEALREQGIMIKIFDFHPLRKSGGEISKKLNHLIWLLQFFTCTRLDLWHIHAGSWLDRAIIIFIARRRKIKTVLTFHSLRDDFTKMPFRQKYLILYVVKQADYLIAAGEKEKEKLMQRFNCQRRLSVQHAFIPPKRVNIELPEQFSSFIRRHKFIISANASNMDFYQGVEIYGLDLLVELCGRLSRSMDVGFVYCLTHLTDRGYWERIQSRIKELKIEESFLLILDGMEFWPVLAKSHLFIRPTCTDSYGVSIAEALSLGIPSVASNVCPRPEGAILFQNRDIEDLYTKVIETINNYEQCKAGVQRLELASCVPALLKVYQNLVG